MKRVSLISLLIFLSISSFGQKIRFSDSTNVWNYTTFSNGIYPPTLWPHTDFFVGDTLISGIQYKMLSHDWPIYSLVFIREDTVLKKVFAIKPVHDTDTSEKLLYDYTLNVGDTFRTIDDRYYVYRIDSVLFNAAWYKVWYFHDASLSGLDQVYMEGIGSIYDPCAMITPFGGTGEFENLMTCFHNWDSASAIVPPFGPYDIDTGPFTFYTFYFNNTTSCNPYALTTSATSGYIPVTVFPNPVENEITITASYTITSVSITSLIGQIVYAYQCNADKIKVDVADLPAGVYLVRINGTEMRKFIKY